MTHQYVLLPIVLATAACAPPARDVTFFEAHPEVAAEVAAGCAAGTHRGAECINARAAASSLRRHKRMEAYKKNF